MTLGLIIGIVIGIAIGVFALSLFVKNENNDDYGDEDFLE